jgi:hypothetical protein
MGYIVLLLAVGVTIYALVDCWNSTDDEVRGLPRLAWLLVVLLFPLVGGIAYLTVGRDRDRSGSPRLNRPRVVAPDDDPDFLSQLDQQRRRAAAEQRRTEQQQRKERKDREKQDRKDRKERQGDHDGEDYPGRPSSS